jgi:hypothetical protein
MLMVRVRIRVSLVDSHQSKPFSLDRYDIVYDDEEIVISGLNHQP